MGVRLSPSQCHQRTRTAVWSHLVRRTEERSVSLAPCDPVVLYIHLTASSKPAGNSRVNNHSATDTLSRDLDLFVRMVLEMF